MGKVKLEELVVELTVENKNLVKSFRESQQETAKASKAMTKSVQDWSQTSSKNASFFQDTMSTMAGFIGGQVILGAFSKLAGAAKELFTTLVTDGVAAAQVQEDSIQKLNTSLALAGEFSSEASKDFQEFASSLQQTTKFGDEVILQNAALIESLGALDTEALKGATTAALDMASALGIDLKAAATLVGKAAVGEISSFTRYGVVIEKGATTAETFSNALDALNSKFGGAAAAQVKTFSGQFQQLNNTFGDATELIGFLFTQNQAILNVFQFLNKEIKDQQGNIVGNTQAWKQLIAEGLIKTIEGLNILVTSFDTVGRVGTATIAAVRRIFADLGSTVTQVLGLFSDDFEETFLAFEMQSKAAGEAFAKSFSEDTTLSDISVKLFQLQESSLSALSCNCFIASRCSSSVINC